ncbi:hypothetical protein Tco_1150799 [Tanacetum coccineum]
MASGAAELISRCVFYESLSMMEMHKEHRPYHKNCSCALHKPNDALPTICLKHRRISYANKLSGNKRSLSIKAFSSSSDTSFTSDGKMKDAFIRSCIRMSMLAGEL